MEISPFLPPKTARDRKIPKACSVKGTGAGIVINDKTQVKAENKEIRI